MKKVVILLIMITCISCASNKPQVSRSKQYHAYVKHKKRTAQDKDYSPYWSLLVFWILVYGYTLTQPSE